MSPIPVAGAVDIGGTKIAVGLVSAEGQILASEQRPTEAERGVQDGLARMAEMLRACLRRCPQVTLAGIGIGCTGPVDPRSGVLGPNNFLDGWAGYNLQAALESEFGVKGATENDADAAALAETRWGAGQGARRCVYLTVSTGIGGGLVFDRRLFRGVDGAHPELGHHTIDPSGPLCFCGMRGCWESLACGPALADWYNQQPGAAAKLDAAGVCRLAAQGDALALRATAREGSYLGLGMANIVSLFTPDVVVLGGGVMESWGLFETQVREAIRTGCGLVPHEKTRLVKAALGMQTGLAGAGAVWFHRQNES